MTGTFIISLDFELMWGVRDKRTIETYGDAIKNVHIIIPELIEVAKKYNIKFTFCSVGFLFNQTKSKLLENIPKEIPTYTDNNLSPYGHYLDSLGADEEADPYHFGFSLIDLIKSSHVHEIGTHTYCHYFALEPGQTKSQFANDIKVACKLAADNEIKLKSIVFPRNQINLDYLSVLSDHGITSFRGTEFSWLYKPRAGHTNSKIHKFLRLTRRILRLLDAYIPISGSNCYDINKLEKVNDLWNLPSSRLLRPFSKKLQLLEILKLNRIKNDMTYAAVNGKMYHLWWHPHNFGRNMRENINFLESIFKHYKGLNEKYSFSSITMHEMAEVLEKKTR